MTTLTGFGVLALLGIIAVVARRVAEAPAPETPALTLWPVPVGVSDWTVYLPEPGYYSTCNRFRVFWAPDYGGWVGADKRLKCCHPWAYSRPGAELEAREWCEERMAEAHEGER